MDIDNRKEVLSILEDIDSILQFKKAIEKTNSQIIDEELQKSLGDGLVNVLMHIDDFDELLIKLLDKKYNEIVEELKKL